MPSVLRSSRRRYEAYRERTKNRRGSATDRTDHPTAPAELHAPDPQAKKKKRTRPFRALVAQFWGLLRGQRQAFILIFPALGISTLLALAPLYGTKIVFDGVLREHPLPTSLPHWIPLPTGRRELLTTVVLLMVGLSAVSEVLGLWSRWQTTRMTKRVQVS